ncbi:hypothetical protein [Agarilytica rhodophyticola]|uniref:hypothetical protein n=1 Tax=Agarilytica rhodophyticola TaxID=1737490 RepID=UPI00131A3369|nr:hypothetical protein [Agarilytica rhodophyticola]
MTKKVLFLQRALVMTFNYKIDYSLGCMIMLRSKQYMPVMQKKFFSIIVFFFVTFFLISIAEASNKDSGYLIKYRILSKSKEVGGITHRIIPRESGYIIAEASEIKTSGWWGKININSSFVETYDLRGKLLSSKNNILDGKKVYNFTTYLDNDYYQVSYRKLEKITSSELRVMGKLNNLITSDVAFDADSMINFSNSIFSGRTEKSEGGKFYVKEFDTTLTYLPMFLQETFNNNRQLKIRVYDSEELEITYQTVVDLGWEDVYLNGKTYRTRHFRLTEDQEERKKYATHIWIANFSINTGDLNISPRTTKKTFPYIIRLTAQDEDGPIEIIIR